jgi:CRISPR-associated RAMP protein (TIGR02581 family)
VAEHHSEAIYSCAALRNRLSITGDLVALTAVRIGRGRASDVVGNDLPVLRDALGRPLIPGASLKGAFRARLEALIAAVAPDEVRTFQQMEQRLRHEIADLKRACAGNDQQFSHAIWREHATLIDLTFGSFELAGRLFFKDALVRDDLWFGQYEERNGVVLHRDTETAQEGLLYNYEVVPSGTRFHFELVMENAAPWQRGMIRLALQPWQTGDAQIGGFRSRGLGYMRVDDMRTRFVDIQHAQDVVRLLQGASSEVSPEQERAWIAAFVAVLNDPNLARRES